MNKKVKDTELAEKLAARAIEVRMEAKKKQEDVRYGLNMNIGRIEIGENCISIPTLLRLCQFYGVTLSHFFKDFEERSGELVLDKKKK